MASSPHDRQTDAALLAASRSGHRRAPRQKAPESYEEKLAQLNELREAAAHSAPEAEEKQHARGKLHRAGAHREAARSGLLPGAGHLRAPPHIRLRHAEKPALGRRRGHGTRDDRRSNSVRLQPGLHRLRRLAGRGHGREDGQDHGPRGEDRLPGHRHQRLGRGAHPGGSRIARAPTATCSCAT